MHRSLVARSIRCCGIVLFSAMFVTFVNVDTAIAQQDWPLRCNLRTSSMGLHSTGFTLNFRGAQAGSNARQPAQGQCAWADRGWGQGEPQRMVWDSGEDLIQRVDLNQDNELSMLALNQRASAANRRTMSTVFQAWRAGGALTLYVRRDGNVMRVTRITQ